MLHAPVTEKKAENGQTQPLLMPLPERERYPVSVETTGHPSPTGSGGRFTRQSAAAHDHSHVGSLQRLYGNQAILQMHGSPEAQLPPLRPLRPSQSGLLQRKCDCGARTSSLSDTCEECSNKRLQAKLAIGASNDPLEQEADRVADQVLAAPLNAAVSGASPRIQRFTGQSTGQMDTAPASVGRVLANPGSPLDPALQQDMEQRFGHDFSQVRVHSGGTAEQSAREVNANAYTVGHNMVFGAGWFAPGTHEGRRLIAHELAHVVQQSARAPSGGILLGSVDSPEEIAADRVADGLAMVPGQGEPLVTADAALTLRAQPNKKAPPKKQKPKIPEMCGRPSRKVPGNSITKVNLDVGANTLTIEWQDKTKIPPGSGGTHSISPGAGLCCVDCNDEKVSQTSGSLCTPKGNVWPVDFTGCALSGHPTAKNPTYFQRGGVAIHSGNTSSPPQSHGCARTSVEISELIHDNVVREQTQIASSGTWIGEKCYLKEASKALSNRKDVCDGNKLKSKNEDKKAKKKLKQNNKPNAPEETPTEQTPKPAQPSMPVAEALPVESDELATVEELEPGVEGQSEMIADGPGPNNEPLSHESIGEVLIADLDLVEKTEEGGDIEDETATV